jgi:hypothetical protein
MAGSEAKGQLDVYRAEHQGRADDASGLTLVDEICERRKVRSSAGCSRC